FASPGLYTTTLTVVDAQAISSVARATTLISAVRPPSIRARGPKRITASSALVSASIYPNGADTIAYLEYGTTRSFGTHTVSGDMGAAKPKDIGRVITGLLPNTTYFYRAVATNSAGTDIGRTIAFTTKRS
ncbi:MAG: hypothetical protein QOH10_1132, partial [Actinomycetota bacterium]|nr:hypothetical protein [Actinomycetota bacterium]